MRKIIKLWLITICLVLSRASFYSPLKAPMVSVVMSSYNREELTERAMNSLINQTYKDIEIIVFNDASSDNTAAVLNDFAYRDKRVKVFHNEKNKGLIHNLNRGLDIARGKYIVRMDDDDVSLPTRIEKQVEFMEKNPQYVVAGTSYYMDEEKPEQAVFMDSSWRDSRILSYMQVPVLHPTTIIRKNFLDKYHIRYDSRFKSAEDTHFWASISKHNGKITNMQDLLFVYTLNSKKYSGYNMDQAKSYIEFLKWSVGSILPADLLEYPPRISQRCFITEELIRAGVAQEYNISPNYLESYRAQWCWESDKISHRTFTIRAPNLRGILIQRDQDSNQACFLESGECAEIIDEFKHVLKIKYKDQEYVLVKTKAGYYV